MTEIYNIAIASDHAGVELKSQLITHLEKQGHKVINLGTDSTEVVDYPDYVNKLKEAISDNIAQYGIVICGTGIGVSIAANRSSNIRAALCFNEYMAERARSHNDANVIALGAKVISSSAAKKMVDKFFSTAFEGGRHLQRLSKIN